MYCIKIKCVMDLLSTSYFALFLIIALGFILGSIKLKGISLDVSAVILRCFLGTTELLFLLIFKTSG